MQLYAPDPVELFDLVEHCTYRPEWKIELVEKAGRNAGGLTLRVEIRGIYNSYKPLDEGPTYSVEHLKPVPAASFDRRSWQRWLFDQLVEIETHECMEWFKINGERPFCPTHAPGDNPYVVHDVVSPERAAINYKGHVPELSRV